RLTNEEGEKLASLHLSLPSSFAKSGLLILDQNYRVLGIDYTHLHLDSAGPKFWMEPNDLTVYIKNENTLHPFAKIDELLGSSSAEILQKTDDVFKLFAPQSMPVDTSPRFNGIGDEDKFTEAMKDETFGGAASLEILLNALFPIKAKLSLIPLDDQGNQLKKEISMRESMAYYDLSKAEGVRVIIEVDVPYFIEGQSALQVRLAEPLGVFSNIFGSENKEIILSESKENDPSIYVKLFTNLQVSQQQAKPGNYFLFQQKKAVIIRDVTKSDINKNKFNMHDLTLFAWVRLTSAGQEEYRSTETIWFPCRTKESFEKSTSFNNSNSWALAGAHLR
ncbi:MAG: hypothetical protein P8176_15005, partial [Gammaproteobacteria bacterium]